MARIEEKVEYFYTSKSHQCWGKAFLDYNKREIFKANIIFFLFHSKMDVLEKSMDISNTKIAKFGGLESLKSPKVSTLHAKMTCLNRRKPKNNVCLSVHFKCCVSFLSTSLHLLLAISRPQMLLLLFDYQSQANL